MEENVTDSTTNGVSTIDCHKWKLILEVQDNCDWLRVRIERRKHSYPMPNQNHMRFTRVFF